MSKEYLNENIASPTSDRERSGKERPQTGARAKERTDTGSKKASSVSYSYLSNPQTKFGSEVPHTIKSDKDKVHALSAATPDDDTSFGILEKLVSQYKQYKHYRYLVSNDSPHTSSGNNNDSEQVEEKKDAAMVAQTLLLVSNAQNALKENRPKSPVSKRVDFPSNLQKQPPGNILPKHPNLDDYRNLANDGIRLSSISPFQVEPKEKKNCELRNVEKTKDISQSATTSKRFDEKDTTDQVYSRESEDREPNVNGPFVLTGNHLCTLSKSQNLFQIFSKHVMSLTSPGQSFYADNNIAKRFPRQDSLMFSDSPLLGGRMGCDNLEGVSSDNRIQPEKELSKSNKKRKFEGDKRPITSAISHLSCCGTNKGELTNAILSYNLPVATSPDIKGECGIKEKSKLASGSKEVPPTSTSMGETDRMGTTAADPVVESGSHLLPNSRPRMKSSSFPHYHSLSERVDPCALAMPAESTDDLSIPIDTTYDSVILARNLVSTSPMFTPRSCSLMNTDIAAKSSSEGEEQSINTTPRLVSTGEFESLMPVPNRPVSNSDSILSVSRHSTSESVKGNKSVDSSDTSLTLPSLRSVWVKVPILSTTTLSENVQIGMCATSEDIVVDLGSLFPVANSNRCTNSSSNPSMPTSNREGSGPPLPLSKSKSRSIWVKVPLNSTSTTSVSEQARNSASTILVSEQARNSASTTSDSEQASMNASPSDNVDSQLLIPHLTVDSTSKSILQQSSTISDSLTTTHNPMDLESPVQWPNVISGSNSIRDSRTSTLDASLETKSEDSANDPSSFLPIPEPNKITAADSSSKPIADTEINAQASSSLASLSKEIAEDDTNAEEELFSHVYGEMREVNSNASQKNSSGLLMDNAKRDVDFPKRSEPNTDSDTSGEDYVYKPQVTAKVKSETLEGGVNRKRRNEKVELEEPDGTSGPHSLGNILPNMRLFFTPLMDDVTRNSVYHIDENTKYEMFPLRMRDDGEIPQIIIRQDGAERGDDKEVREQREGGEQ